MQKQVRLYILFHQLVISRMLVYQLQFQHFHPLYNKSNLVKCRVVDTVYHYSY